MFIVNRIFVHIFQVSHSLREGIAEFYGISGIVDPSFGWTVGVLGIGIDSLRYL